MLEARDQHSQSCFLCQSWVGCGAVSSNPDTFSLDSLAICAILLLCPVFVQDMLVIYFHDQVVLILHWMLKISTIPNIFAWAINIPQSNLATLLCRTTHAQEKCLMSHRTPLSPRLADYVHQHLYPDPGTKQQQLTLTANGPPRLLFTVLHRQPL